VPWQDLYQSCISETDPEQLEWLVFYLKDAIVIRWRQLSSEPDCDQAWELKRGAQKLPELKMGKLGWSDPTRLGSAHLPLANQPQNLDETCQVFSVLPD